MLFGKRNDRVKKIVVYTVAAAFVLSTGIIGVYALMSRQHESVPSTSASDIAVVNGKGIGYYEFLERYRYTYQQYPFFSPGESEYWLRSFVLDQIIAGELLYAEAEKAAIEVDKADIDAIIGSQKASYSDERDYHLYLQSRGMTEADVREAVRASLMIEAYIDRFESTATVSDEEVTAEFETRRARDETLVLEDLEDAIRNDLLEDKKNELLINHINALMQAADIEIMDPVIRAIRAAEDEDFESAAAHYREAIEEYGVDPYLHLALGRVLDRLGDADEALACYQKAVEVDDDVNAEIRMVLGLAYKERGMNQEATDSFRRASEIDAETDPYLHTLLRSEFEELDLPDDVAKEQGIIDRISDETARLQEEYERQLEEYLRALESEQEDSDSSQGPSEVGADESASLEGDGQAD